MTDKLRAAAQAALETLEDVFGKDKIDVGAINNLRAALAKQTVKESLKGAEQKPVAWLMTYGGLTHVEYTQPNMVVDTHYQPLYTSPLAEQKPMLEMNPQKREFVGLTGTEIGHIFARNIGYPESMMKEVETLLKEKNT